MIFFAYVGSGHFLGFKIFNFNIFWGFQQNEYFGGMKILWMFSLGHHKLDYILGSFPYTFKGLFLSSKLRESGIFFEVAKISNIFCSA